MLPHYRFHGIVAYRLRETGRTEKIRERTHLLTEDTDCTGLVVKDGLLVGVLIRSYWRFLGDCVCLPYGQVCTYYASDNEGSGTNDREDYAYLICV